MSYPPNVYKPCTLNGAWYDTRKEPGRPASRPCVLTETQLRQAEVAGLPTPTFGASLASTYSHLKSIEDHFDYSNLVYPDRRYCGATSASIQQTTHFGKAAALDTADFSTSYRLGGPEVARDPAQLAAYRSQHTADARGGAAVAQRFTTAYATSTGGSAVPLRYQPTPARPLAGQVKSCDLLLAKACDVHGWHAALRLLLALPPTFDKLVLRACLARLGLRPLSISEEKELMKDLCSSPEGHDMTAARSQLLARLTQPLAPPAHSAARQQALDRAWAECCYTAALRGEVPDAAGGAAPGTPTSLPASLPLGAVLQCLDAANHPDARRSPALRSAAQAGEATAAGLSACIRLVDQGSPAASPALLAAEQRARSTVVVQPPRDGSVVSATLSSSVPLPLGQSRRMANGDFLVVRNTVVGVPGRQHADPPAGCGSSGGAGGGGAGAVKECIDWGVGFGGQGRAAGAAGSPTSTAVGAPPLDAAATTALVQSQEAEALLAPLPPSTPLSRAAFQHYYELLCSPCSPSEDAFCRALDTLFHVAPQPHIASVLPAVQSSAQEGVVAWARGGGQTEHSVTGSGLRFSSRPYDPTLRTQPPRRLPPASDPDSKFTQGSASTVALLVAHRGGGCSVERVPNDRFMPSAGQQLTQGQQAALLVRLGRMGVHTAVSAQMAAF